MTNDSLAKASKCGVYTFPQGGDLIYLLAPTSTEERIRLVAERSRGFIYLVSLTGVTGARDKLSSGLEAFVTRVRNVATQPVCVGFGISTPEQARHVARIADGVIVGSWIIQLTEAKDNLLSAGNFIKGLRHVLDDLPKEKSYEGMVLVTGYFLLVKTNVAQPPVSPVGLEYIGEALNRAKVPVQVLDLTFETDWKTALARKLKNNGPPFV